MGVSQFSKLSHVAVRLGLVAVLSADVKRSCKAHKVSRICYIFFAF